MLEVAKISLDAEPSKNVKFVSNICGGFPPPQKNAFYNVNSCGVRWHTTDIVYRQLLNVYSLGHEFFAVFFDSNDQILHFGSLLRKVTA